MNWTSNASTYGRLSIALHWLMLILLAAVYATMEFKGVFPRGSEGRARIMNLHYVLGLVAFGLAWVRILLRIPGTSPVIDPAPPKWQVRLAKAVQGLLYLLMVGLPLLGWLALSAHGETVDFFGTPLPSLLAENPTLRRPLKEIHETLATAGYFLIGLHAAAALFHHYVMHDNTLKLMLPRR